MNTAFSRGFPLGHSGNWGGYGKGNAAGAAAGPAGEGAFISGVFFHSRNIARPRTLAKA